MERYLMILEVSQKQAYIFGSRKLKENLLRSKEIEYITEPDFFEKVCPDGFNKNENLVYTGGGHAVLQFDSMDAATNFSKRITTCVLRELPQLELFVKIEKYDEMLKPGENLNRLSAELEKKKSRRESSFRLHSFGVEGAWVSTESGKYLTQPENDKKEDDDETDDDKKEEEYIPTGWRLTTDNSELAGKSEFLAVVHLDGNAMGKRVQNIYDEQSKDWDACVKMLKDFSGGIEGDFKAAYNDMAKQLAEYLKKTEAESEWAEKRVFPLRKVISAGDDVCFICSGAYGLGCAVQFLKSLAGKTNEADGQSYSACAGIVFIHKKFPFRYAYDLSEELCTNAKNFGSEYDSNGGISAIDWHIEFGQMKGSLSQIRQEYETEDHNRMELRPVAVMGYDKKKIKSERGYKFFYELTALLQEKQGDLPRSKMKEMRNAFRQGEIETALALRQAQFEKLLEYGVEQRFPKWRKTLQDSIDANKSDKLERAAFVWQPKDKKKRCLYFDAIELMDHVTLWEDSL